MGKGWTEVEEVVVLVRALGVPQAISSAIEQLIRHHAEPTAAPEEPVRRLFIAPDVSRQAPIPKDVGVVAGMFHKRALKRANLLGDDLATDLAWQMLLALTAEDAKGRGIAVSGLCVASGGPPTTALRHIAAMERRGLIQRVQCPKDARRTCVHLTDETRCRMHDMLIDFCVPPPLQREPSRPVVFAD